MKLIRIIDNLINNAIKFTPRKGSVSLQLVNDNKQVKISICDTGIGIPKKYNSLLFTKNQSVQRQGTESEPSNGLGLYICRLMADEINATINFHNNTEVGTTFNLIFDINQSIC